MIALWHNEASPNGAVNTVRALAHLLDLSERQAVMHATRTCSILQCGRPHDSLGYCAAHAAALRAHGSPYAYGPVHGPLRSDRPCKETDCDSPVGRGGARGWCYKHYVRWKVQGDPQKLGYKRGAERAAQLPHGPAHHQWRGGISAYDGVHQRIVMERGKASAYPCVQCGRQALDWAYNHTDPNPLMGNRGYPYSLDANRYDPMCRSCHKLFDAAQRRSAGEG